MSHQIIQLMILEMKINKINHTDTTSIDLGLDMDTNIVNIKSVSV